MEFLPISFLAGILTILAPCILPLLPVIIGGSLSEQDKKRPLIITLSLAASIVIFTLLLKVSTLFIDIPQDFWKWFSSGIVFLFALSLLFPDLWPKISLWFGKITGQKESLEHKSQKVLFKFYNKKGFWPAVALGGALGPVFASCSPTYFLILGTVLPNNFFIGTVNLIAYALGLALVMFLVAYAGQKFTKVLNIAANPKGWFKKGLGILFLIVALAIAGGYDKKLSTYLLDNGLFDVTKVEERILEKQEARKQEKNNDSQINEKLNQEDLFNANYAAPELAGLTNWMNSKEISSLEELKGKVVLVDFWTYSCINCIRTLPYLQDWHEKYSDDGLVILGIHAPEFAFERKAENVKKAAEEYGLSYPIVLDNDFSTWRNYKNRYWPAKYLIDKEGTVRYTHFGEGAYIETEKAITTLLNQNIKQSETEAENVNFKKIKTHETYLGTARRSGLVEKNTSELKNGEWILSGDWDSDEEKIILKRAPAELSLKFNASKANLVLNGNAEVEVFIDGEKYKEIKISGANLYRLFESELYKERLLTLKFKNGFAEAFAFTFG